MRNNRKSIIRSLALGVSLLLVAGAAATLSRASVAGVVQQTPCTTANVAGDYGFMATGRHANLTGLRSGDFTATGIISFDNHGSYTVSNQSISYSGQIVNNLVDSGQYSISPECVCTTSAGVGFAAGGLGPTHAVFVNDRREAFMITQHPGTVISYVLKRIE